jgi:hypothetical protein
MAKHDSNTIIKFANNTTVVGLITDNDETAYRKEYILISVEGLLLAYLHSTAWVGRTVKDQYGIFHFW